MTQLFTTRSNDPKRNAQLNLDGRTHYVDDDTLRFHKARILSTATVDQGLLFALVESVGLDMDNTRRGFRYVVFDVFGTVISRVDLESCWSNRAGALKAMWDFLDTINARTHTLDAIRRQERQHAQEMSELRAKLTQAAA